MRIRVKVPTTAIAVPVSGGMDTTVADSAFSAADLSGIASAITRARNSVTAYVPFPEASEMRRLAATLLAPVSLAGFTFAGWQLSSELGWAGSFFIGTGPLAHWIVWLAIGAGVMTLGNALKRAEDAGQPPEEI